MKNVLWPKVQETVVEGVQTEILAMEERRTMIKRDISIEKTSRQTHTVTRNKFGFAVSVEEEIDRSSEITELTEKVKGFTGKIEKARRFAQTQIDLAESLAQKGIGSIAIVPTALFNSLCKQFGLYRFENLNEAGQTKIHNLDVGEIVSVIAVGIFTTILLSLLGIFALGGTIWTVLGNMLICGAIISAIEFSGKKRRLVATALLFVVLAMETFVATTINWTRLLSSAPGFWNYVVFDLVGVVVTALTFLCSVFFVLGFDTSTKANGPGQKIAKSVFQLLYRCYLTCSPRGQLIKSLWPSGVDQEEGKKVQVQFPRAPESFVRVLSLFEKNGLRPMIAAVPKAIVVNRTEVVQTRMREIEEMKWDPILYHKEGDLVAIVSSFGSFADEKKVLEWVKKEGLQTCFN